MTSTADTTQHPDVSEISDLAEGLLPPSRTADVRRHLDGCELCADVRTSLQEIRALLGTLPGPARMPADVAERIDAALAAEALLDATAPEHPADVSRETTTPPSAARPAGRPRAATGPGRSPAPRKRRRQAVLGAVFGLAAVGVGALVLQVVRSSGDEPSKSSTAAVAEGDVKFSGVALQQKVETLLAPGPSLEASGKEESGKPPQRSFDAGAPTGRQNTMKNTVGAGVPSCVQQGTGRSEPPIAADEGDYAGTRAYLVVLPHAGDATKVDVLVMDASCATSPRTDDTASILLTRSYTRP
ncbi:zf-HC2 domain-containing protein [Streptomyces coeruleoprunus]|uniref:Zf-HC2 domain-containing protein n=1 Tax=Streptomyces coeruleoprunus TaxID=285563 RepID=A0ABV9XAZ0_9ACTN